MKLHRDRMWTHNGATQLEFVVDNATMASLANLEMRVHNPLYVESVRVVRDGLRRIFTSFFDAKAGFLNPVEWRPRGFNAPQDVVF